MSSVVERAPRPLAEHVLPTTARLFLSCAEEVFGAGGWLESRLPDYQPRHSQLAMAREVEANLAQGGRLLVEAPTGTGKSLAYCVPAIRHALRTNQRVLIATANIALQEQLVRKDLPFLARVLPTPFRYGLLKGRANFLCADHLQGLQSQLLRVTIPEEDQREFNRVMAWAEDTLSGDVGELPIKVSPRIWRHFSVADTNECAGCRISCFHKAAMHEAEEAHVVVCNYHLLFAHLAVKAATGGQAGVLPDFDVLICDEAHEMPEIGGSFASEEIGRWSFRGFRRHLSDKTFAALDQVADDLSRSIGRAGFHHGKPGSGRLTLPGLVDDAPILACLDEVVEELQSFKKHFEDGDKEHAQLSRQEEQARLLVRRVKALVWQERPDWVYWVERHESPAGDSWKLKGKPVSVAPLLQRTLHRWVPCLIATSATLTTTRGDFQFIRERLGLDPGTRQLALPSPFDFNRSALVVVPRGLPEPTDPAHRDRVHELLERAVTASQGRALLLFTSSQALKTAHQILVPAFARLGFTCHCQGEAPSTQLISRFQEDVSSVLFATRTFFQGVDVPGESLSLVALDRLPFPSPADPVMDHIAEHDPKGWFHRHSLPTALITWRQIFGRLIRRHDDRGVVLLLDGRVESKAYGKQFLRALPGGLLAREVAAIGSFLGDPEDPFA